MKKKLWAIVLIASLLLSLFVGNISVFAAENKLSLTAQTSDDPNVQLFKLENPNNVDKTITWGDVNGNVTHTDVTVPANSSIYLRYDDPGMEGVRIYVSYTLNNEEKVLYAIGSNSYWVTIEYRANGKLLTSSKEAIAKKDRRGLWQSALVQVGLVAAVVAVFILFCPLVIRLLTAGRYMDSVIYARLVSVSVVTSAVYYVINNYTIARGYPKLYLYTTVICSILIVIAYPAAVGRFGFSGGAAMTGMSFVLLAAVNLILLGIVRWQNRRGQKGIR